MENIKDNSKPIHNDLIDDKNIDRSEEKENPINNELIDGENLSKEGYRNDENIDKNSSSNVRSLFEKNHSRSNRSLGGGHEPGTLPGGGV